MKKFLLSGLMFLIVLGLSAQIKTDTKVNTTQKKTVKPLLQQNRTIFFSEDFENGNLNGWITIDNDGDGYEWVNAADVAGTSDELVAHTGNYCAGSASYTNVGQTALTPDNWLISPAIDLSSASGTVLLEWYAGPQRQTWPEEHYKVMVSTSGTAISDFTDNIFEETLQAGGQDGNNYFKRTADLSSYSGGTIYIAFVHYNCTDKFWIGIDDISVYENNTTDMGITAVLSPNNDAGCQLSANESVTIRLFNYGGTSVSNFPVSYAVNGGTPVSETVSASIAPATYYDYTFSQTVDLSALDYYTITCNVNATNDIDAGNNNMAYYVSSTDANISVQVQADNHSGQSWDIVTTAGDTIFKHGPYQWNVDSTYTVCVIANDCYTFNWHGGTSNTVTVSYNGTQVDQTTATGDYSLYSIGGNCPAVDAKLSVLTYPGYSDPGVDLDITGTIINVGQDPITSFDVNYTIDGGTPVGAYSITGLNLITGNSYDFTHNIPFNETTEALYHIKVTISNVNGGADANISNDTLSKSVLVSSSMMQRKVVLEQFTTENCPNCPPVLSYLEPIVDGDENIILLTHHSGYYTDWLTIPEDNDMLVFYNDGGSTYAPAGMVDRHYNGQDNDGDGTPEPGPVFWDGDPYGGTALNNRLGVPALVSVNIGGTYDQSTHQLNITVYGDFLTDFSGTIGTSLWITEDGITTTNQSGASGTWTHRFTARDAISDEWGDAITSPTTAGNSYSKTYTYTVNSSWDYNNLYLVAMVNQIDGSNVNNREIHNANQVQLNALQPVNITSLNSNNNIRIYPNPSTGKFNLINVSGKKIEVFNMLGEKITTKTNAHSIEVLNLSTLENGTYIIKITDNSTVVTKQIILNK